MRRVLLYILVTISAQAFAYDTTVHVTGKEIPAELQDVGVTELLGGQLDLENTFTDESGQTVKLGQFFHDDRPVLMAMVYYTCPSLCNYHLNGLTEAMKSLKWTSGKDFQLVAVSMNSNEKSDVAGKKKENYLKLYDRHQGDSGWHFLVGNEANVKKLADELGFRFRYLPEKKQFAHASVTYVITPQGKISRYLHGIQIDESTLKLSLLEASNGKIGSVIEHALMFCFQYNPVKNKYTLYAWNIMRLGGLLMVFLLAIVLLPIWWRENKKQRLRNKA